MGQMVDMAPQPDAADDQHRPDQIGQGLQVDSIVAS
jgi:hypothetical protein